MLSLLVVLSSKLASSLKYPVLIFALVPSHFSYLLSYKHLLKFLFSYSFSVNTVCIALLLFQQTFVRLVIFNSYF